MPPNPLETKLLKIRDQMEQNSKKCNELMEESTLSGGETTLILPDNHKHLYEKLQADNATLVTEARKLAVELNKERDQKVCPDVFKG